MSNVPPNDVASLIQRVAPVIHVSVVPLGSSTASRVEFDQSSRVHQFDYEEDERAADKVSLQIDNWDLSNFDDPIWAKGNTVLVAWGYAGNMSPTRQCVIQSVKGFTTLTVEALGEAILMHKQTKSRTFVNMTRPQVIKMIAAENGYGARQQDVETKPDDVVYEHIVQARETDAAFMMRLARRQGYEFFVDFDGLHWHPRKLGQTPVREFIYYSDPGQGDVLEISIENDVTVKPATVVVKGRDPMAKTDIAATASNDETQGSILGSISEIFTSVGNSLSGGDASDGAPDAASATVSTGSNVIKKIDVATGTGQYVEVASTEPTAEAAKKQADGIFKNARMTAVELTMKAIGDPSLVAKTVVKISNIRSLSGNYYVSKVKHSLGAGLYTMDLTCRRDGRSSRVGNAPNAKGNLNAKDASNDPNALQPKKVVNGQTGETTIQYVDTRGREQGAGGGTE